MLPNFYHHVSFSRRQFSLARILFSARLFFGPTFFFSGTTFVVPKGNGAENKKSCQKKSCAEKKKVVKKKLDDKN